LVVATSVSLHAQSLRLGVHSVTLTHTEVSEDLSSVGVGAGGLLGVRWHRLGLEGTVYRAEMAPDSADLTDFTLTQFDMRLSFWLATMVALEVGGGRRKIEPEFAAQDVSAFRMGILSEYPLARMSEIWVRGAYLLDPKFNGGGTAGLAVELGLGVAVGTNNGRFRVGADAEFQRIDRSVNNVEVPIQVTVARFGVQLAF
jgi:hypothetical protein